MVGMHGHLMFRPHMREDWVIWGLATAFFFLGVALVVLAIRKEINRKSLR